MSFKAHGGQAEASDEAAESLGDQYLLPPMPGSIEKGLGALPPVKGMEACCSQDVRNLAELAGSCLIWSGDQRTRKYFGLKGLLFHLSENRQGRGVGVQCRIKHPIVKTS